MGGSRNRALAGSSFRQKLSRVFIQDVGTYHANLQADKKQQNPEKKKLVSIQVHDNRSLGRGGLRRCGYLAEFPRAELLWELP